MSEPSSTPDLPWWLKPGFGAWAVPESLTQPINPGWSFGNLIVDNRNSSAPDTEQRIVAAESYGRQIGKLMDAVAALIEDPKSPGARAAFAELLALRDRVEAAKREAARDRVEQFLHDLETLKGTPEYEALLARSPFG